MLKALPQLGSIKDASVLLLLGDSVTTDHISPAGSIARNSPAARYLAKRGYLSHYFTHSMHYIHFLSLHQAITSAIRRFSFISDL